MGDETYEIKIAMNLEGLHGLPPNTGPGKAFLGIFLEILKSGSDKVGGLTIKEQFTLKQIRDKFDEAVKTNGETITLNEKQMALVDKLIEKSQTDMNMNEGVVRVATILMETLEKYEKSKPKQG